MISALTVLPSNIAISMPLAQNGGDSSRIRTFPAIIAKSVPAMTKSLRG
jgi:hypothetical protein